ncbi:NAD-dependent epimerase/dehydratase family protein [Streptomyces marianii]|uniref:NAD-dependent epimerase/dehydratase n=1 Tax=Streptomyces marianii TaxID=1817406 RepID=A0A5R9E1D0_9ACTN|nr:NAD-dependent epimerase/dehydratase family protein [Streptomyces marianii]TLQ43751.1 NAD-dependent epimerase/dehydratase [Streptomyces marianii]
MRVVVLGATGSVGRQVCAAYAAQGWDVHGVARRPAPHLDRCGFTALDLTAAAPGRTAAVLGDPPADVVVNAAGGWGDTEEEMTYSHLRLVRRLVEALALLTYRPRLVHLGSVHEYGPVPAGTLLREDLMPEPVTPYARIKLETSSAVLAAARTGVLDAVVLRAANMSGPHPPRESFLADLMARISTALADGGRLELSVADARRDFVDVRDVAQAVVRAGRAPAAGGLVVNIGRGEAVPIGDLVGWLLEAAAFPEDRVERRATPVRSKGGDWTRLDIGRARRLLPWAPRIGLRDSVHSMWRTDHGAPA